MPNTDIDLEKIVTEYICRLGIPAHLKGYRYLRTALMLTAENAGLTDNVTNELYPRVAKIHDTTPSKVERTIGRAIDKAWLQGDPAIIRELFGGTAEEGIRKPTNAEFIALVTDMICLKIRYPSIVHF